MRHGLLIAVEAYGAAMTGAVLFLLLRGLAHALRLTARKRLVRHELDEAIYDYDHRLL